MLQNAINDFQNNVLMPIAMLLGLVVFGLTLAGQAAAKNKKIREAAWQATKAVGKAALDKHLTK